MSGEKDHVVAIRQSEKDRMMGACQRVDAVESNMRLALQQSAARINSEISAQINSVSQRNDRFEHRLSDMSAALRQHQQETNHQLRAHGEAFQQALRNQQHAFASQLSGQRMEYLTLIEAQSKKFHTALENQRAKLQGQITGINNRLDLHDKQESSREALARRWLKDAQGLLEFIGKEYRHDKFKPGALQKLQAEHRLAQGNLDQGSSQAASATAQQAFLKASDLRLELEMLEQEWNAYLSAALTGTAAALAACAAQESCRFMLSTEDGAEEMAGQVDFWSEGALSELKRKVEAEQKRLAAPEPLTLEQLKQSLRDSETWRQESLILAERAKESLIASQLRQNIAESIAAALESKGFTVMDSTYEGEDYRGALHIKLKNYNDDEIVTVIAPQETAQGSLSNHLNIAFFDRSTNDESFRQARLEAITEQLRDTGVDCGPATCKPGTESSPCTDTGKLDLDKVRRQPRASRSAASKR